MYDQTQIGRQLNNVSQIQFVASTRLNYIPEGPKKAFRFDEQLSQWRTTSHPTLRTNRKVKLPQLIQNQFNQSNLPLLRNTYYNLENLTTDRYEKIQIPINHISNEVISIRYPRQTVYQKRNQPCLEPKPVIISLPKAIINKRKQKCPSIYQKNPINSNSFAVNQQMINPHVKKKSVHFGKYIGYRNGNRNYIRNKSQHHQNSKNQIVFELDAIERQHKKGKMRGSICKKKIWTTQKDKQKQRNLIFQLGQILKSQKNQNK